MLSQVSNAVDHVQQGNTALQRAKSLQKNSRKWTCIAIIILLIIVAIIVLAVLKPWNNSKGAWLTFCKIAIYIDAPIDSKQVPVIYCGPFRNPAFSYFCVDEWKCVSYFGFGLETYVLLLFFNAQRIRSCIDCFDKFFMLFENVFLHEMWGQTRRRTTVW